jgi:AcrR family transcriptional regulator
MTTEAKFKYALKEMMLSKPLEEINVTVLCDKCGCHRQTFYYHYQDIYDLLAAIFLNEDIAGLDKAKEIPDALRCFPRLRQGELRLPPLVL